MGGKAIFVLDARADLTPDEKGLVKKYALGKLVVYDFTLPNSWTVKVSIC